MPSRPTAARCSSAGSNSTKATKVCARLLGLVPGDVDDRVVVVVFDGRQRVERAPRMSLDPHVLADHATGLLGAASAGSNTANHVGAHRRRSAVASAPIGRRVLRAPLSHELLDENSAGSRDRASPRGAPPARSRSRPRACEVASEAKIVRARLDGSSGMRPSTLPRAVHGSGPTTAKLENALTELRAGHGDLKLCDDLPSTDRP
jgi:hypothetical protein